MRAQVHGAGTPLDEMDSFMDRGVSPILITVGTAEYFPRLQHN